VSITEELLGRNSSGSGQENREYDRGIRCADHATPSVRKSLHYFAKKRRSLGRHSSLVNQSHGVLFVPRRSRDSDWLHDRGVTSFRPVLEPTQRAIQCVPGALSAGVNLTIHLQLVLRSRIKKKGKAIPVTGRGGP
jgi:hypothetical protein